MGGETLRVRTVGIGGETLRVLTVGMCEDTNHVVLWEQGLILSTPTLPTRNTMVSHVVT